MTWKRILLQECKQFITVIIAHHTGILLHIDLTGTMGKVITDHIGDTMGVVITAVHTEGTTGVVITVHIGGIIAVITITDVGVIKQTERTT